MPFFAIPSYKRHSCFILKTLPLLLRLQVQTNMIYIFIVEDESLLYKEALKIYKDINIITGPLGLHNMRNFIQNYFPESSYILHFDDDIDDLLIMTEDTTILDKKSSKRYPLFSITIELFNKFITNAYNEMIKNQSKLFGIYPVKNGYFMKDLPEITTDLRFCVGAVWGCINEHSQDLQLELEEKEDFERTLRYYTKYGKVIRFNRIVPKTSYYKTLGGMQSRPDNRMESSKISCQYLLNHFPNLCKLYTSKKSGIYEVRLINR